MPWSTHGGIRCSCKYCYNEWPPCKWWQSQQGSDRFGLNAPYFYQILPQSELPFLFHFSQFRILRWFLSDHRYLYIVLDEYNIREIIMKRLSKNQNLYKIRPRINVISGQLVRHDVFTFNRIYTLLRCHSQAFPHAQRIEWDVHLSSLLHLLLKALQFLE
jgi:hypothetical protein